MIKHLVFFKYKPEITPEQKKKHKAMIEGLKGLLPEMKKFECLISKDGLYSSHDVAIDSEFATEQALHDYQVHPKHKELVAYNKEIIENVARFDYLMK